MQMRKISVTTSDIIQALNKYSEGKGLVRSYFGDSSEIKSLRDCCDTTFCARKLGSLEIFMISKVIILALNTPIHPLREMFFGEPLSIQILEVLQNKLKCDKEGGTAFIFEIVSDLFHKNLLNNFGLICHTIHRHLPRKPYYDDSFTNDPCFSPKPTLQLDNYEVILFGLYCILKFQHNKQRSLIKMCNNVDGFIKRVHDANIKINGLISEEKERERFKVTLDNFCGDNNARRITFLWGTNPKSGCTILPSIFHGPIDAVSPHPGSRHQHQHEEILRKIVSFI